MFSSHVRPFLITAKYIRDSKLFCDLYHNMKYEYEITERYMCLLGIFSQKRKKRKTTAKRKEKMGQQIKKHS
jgi:hypothetical protein